MLYPVRSTRRQIELRVNRDGSIIDQRERESAGNTSETCATPVASHNRLPVSRVGLGINTRDRTCAQAFLFTRFKERARGEAAVLLPEAK